MFRWVLLAAFFWGLSSAAQAQAPRTASMAVVHLDGATGCADTRMLALRIEQRLGHTAFVGPTDAELFLEARLFSRDGHIVAEVRGSDRDGQSLGIRTIEHESTDCASFTEQLSLVISLIIDPEAALRPREVPAPEQPPAPQVAPPAPQPPPTPPPAPAATQRPRRNIRDVALDVRVTASATLVLGLVPSYGIGGNIRGAIEPRGWIPLFLGATILAPAHESFPDTPRATYEAFWGEIGACPLDWSTGVLHLGGCLGLQVGGMIAALAGASVENKTESFVLVAPTADAEIALNFNHFTIGLRASIAVPLRRYDFALLADRPAEIDGFSMYPVTGAFSFFLGANTF